MFDMSIIKNFVYKEVVSNDIFNGNSSDVVGKQGKILGIVIFICDICFQNVSYVFLSLYNGEPLYETVGDIETPGLCIFD